MTDKRKRQARLISLELDIAYTHALRLVDAAYKADPTATERILRNRCRELLDSERVSRSRDATT